MSTFWYVCLSLWLVVCSHGSCYVLTNIFFLPCNKENSRARERESKTNTRKHKINTNVYVSLKTIVDIPKDWDWSHWEIISWRSTMNNIIESRMNVSFRFFYHLEEIHCACASAKKTQTNTFFLLLSGINKRRQDQLNRRINLNNIWSSLLFFYVFSLFNVILFGLKDVSW